MANENRLGEFLRARREQVAPAQVGLPDAGGRRVPGLRRAEVAALAGVSTDYYVRLEQGRERHPSTQVLSAVARALRLDADGTDYLFRVAESLSGQRRPARSERVSAHLLRLLDGWLDTPAMVISPARDILALNALGRALYGSFASTDNLLRMVFLDPVARRFYVDWESAARGSVSALRAAAGDYPDDPGLIALVGELCMKSQVFCRLWARHEVRPRIREDKRLHHPQVGDLTVHYEAFTVNAAPGQQLLVYQAEPGSPSADALALLGSLSAQEVDQRPAADAHALQEVEDN